MSDSLRCLNMTRGNHKRNHLLFTKRIRAALSDVSDFNSMENLKSFPSFQMNSAVEPLQATKKSSKQKPSKKTTYKHIPHSEKPAHLVAKRNERERKRVQAVNSAFLRLRKHVPHEPRHKRLSKFKTLKVAIQYIRHLQDLIQSHDYKMTARYKYVNNGHHDLSHHKPPRSFHSKRKVELQSCSIPLSNITTAAADIDHINFESYEMGNNCDSNGYFSSTTHVQNQSSSDYCLYSGSSSNSQSRIVDLQQSHNFKPSQVTQNSFWPPREIVQFNRNNFAQNHEIRNVSEINHHLDIPGHSDSTKFQCPRVDQWNTPLDTEIGYEQHCVTVSSVLPGSRNHSATPDSVTSSLDSWNNSSGILGNLTYSSFQENNGILPSHANSPCGSFLN